MNGNINVDSNLADSMNASTVKIALVTTSIKLVKTALVTTSIKQKVVLCDLNCILLSQYISYEINLYLATTCCM